MIPRALASLTLTLALAACGDAGPRRTTITTIAGLNSDAPDYADGEGAAARFNGPEGLALDAAGEHLYIADSNNHVIRRLELSTMRVTTVAGVGGQSGDVDSSGSGATFVPARLRHPRSLALDAAGTGLYFTDTGNYVIRRLDLVSGQVTTEFGQRGFAGLIDGIGTEARFGRDGLGNPWPGGLLLDATSEPGRPTLYVADSANQAIRAIDLSSGLVRTVAGAAGAIGAADGPVGSATFNKPAGLALDAAGRIYVSEANNLDVRRIDLTGGEVTTIAGKAPADPTHICELGTPVLPPECGDVDAPRGLDARFRFPYGVASDGAQGFFLVDSHSNVIRHVDMQTTAVRTVAGTAAEVLDDFARPSKDTTDEEPGTFSHPSHVAFLPPNVLLVADRSASCIRRVELVAP